MEDSCQIPGKGAGEKDSQFQDRHNNPHNFTVPVEQNTQPMVTGDSSQRRHQNRSNIEVIRDDYVIGDCNMGRGGHNVEAASSSQGGMVGAGDSTRIPATNLGNLQNEKEMEIQHREGKHHVQALRQSRTSHMDEQLIKNQSKNTIHKVNATNVRYDRPTGNIPNLLKTDPLAAPAPYTVVQTYADRLRYNQAKCDVSITLTTPEITTKQGLPAVLYVKEEVMKDLAATYKYTLIGHPYIDLDNELNYNMVWTKQRMSITGQTRGSQARVKVQVDLTLKRSPYIWMGYVGEDITDGRWQKIEYDNIPDYCFYCKHQGHLESDCTIRQRD
ncbi:hypothetical protein KY289_030416 [Solanum tuberosum]|nr:hypothetical protein KY289_030416 [Solanum tuberosum]